MVDRKKKISFFVMLLCLFLLAMPTVWQVNATEEEELLYVTDTPGIDYEYRYYPVLKDGEQTVSTYITDDVIVMEPKTYAADSEMEKVIQEALSYVKPEMSDLEKVLVLHDWLSAHCDYDYLNYLKDEIPSVSYNEYGAFVNGKAVCAGYADAYGILMQRVGIESYYVSSQEINHAWNLVYVDGYWHHLDVTWTDPVSTANYDFVNEGYTSHEYFMRSDKEYREELGHPGFQKNLPGALLSDSYGGYIFRDVDSRMNYYEGYWYYLEEGGFWGNSENTYITKAKINGTERTELPITGYASYMHLYGSKLFYNVSEETSYPWNSQYKIYSYDLDTGEEKLELDISGAYPGYFISEFGLKRNKLIVVLSDEEETSCIRLVINPEELGSSAVLADEITFYNRSVTRPVTVYGNTATGYTYTSANTSIATVDAGGNITATGVGSTTITVKDSAGKTVTTCKVIVDDSFFATDLVLTDVPEEIGTGFNAALGVASNYEYAKLYNIAWSSSDESIASVDADGVVTAIAPGKVTITAKDLDSGHSASGTITAVKTIPVTGVELDKNSLLINKYGQVEQITATVYPADATCQDVKWSLEYSGMCPLNGWNGGTVTAKRDGTGILTVTTIDGGFTASCEVTVKVTEYNGVDYSDVFDYEMYKIYHEEVLNSIYSVDEAIKYFVEEGMSLGHQACDRFDVEAYKKNYPELVSRFGSDNKAYYTHYMTTGKAEGKTAVSGIAVAEAYFPDEVFRNYVKENFDVSEGTEGVLTVYELGCVKEIDVPYEDISSLKGIELFGNLKTLLCYGTDITELDISKNTKLQTVYCHNTAVTELDIRNNPDIYYLRIGIGEVYSCGGNYELSNIKGFAEENASEWQDAVCENGKLVIKDYDTGYGYVRCSYKNANGRKGYIYFYFDYKGEHKYVEGYCEFCGAQIDGIEINEINFPDEVFREYVREEFDTEEGTEGFLTRQELEDVTRIDVSETKIASLRGIEYFTDLKHLYCQFTELTELDVRSNTKLRNLWCFCTGITSLDVSNNTELYALYCDNMQLAFLDVSNNRKLDSLDCYGNAYDLGYVYESFDLSQIPGFDVSRASKWVGATCENGKLANFDESGGMVSVSYIYDCGNGFSEEFTMVATVVEETEGAVEFVNRMYEVILERTPDEGSHTWVNLLMNGAFTGAEVAKGFIMSDEFLNKEMAHEEFVQILYQAFFGRQADPNGLVTWVDFLNQGYRKSFIFSGFANSLEFASLCEEYGVEAGVIPVTVSEQQPNLSEEDYNVWLFVERMYTEVLKRTPDMAGIQEWVGYLQDGTYTGAEVASGFILSEEFQTKEMSNEEYVQIMYQAFFGREADEGGLETWTNALENGYTKRYIFAGFANSNEFEALCESYGITRGSVEVEQ